jgi:hypothetical protein
MAQNLLFFPLFSQHNEPGHRHRYDRGKPQQADGKRPTPLKRVEGGIESSDQAEEQHEEGIGASSLRCLEEIGGSR